MSHEELRTIDKLLFGTAQAKHSFLQGCIFSFRYSILAFTWALNTASGSLILQKKGHLSD